MARIKIEDLPRPETDAQDVRSLRGGTLMSPLALLGSSRRPSVGTNLLRASASLLRVALR